MMNGKRRDESLVGKSLHVYFAPISAPTWANQSYTIYFFACARVQRVYYEQRQIHGISAKKLCP